MRLVRTLMAAQRLRRVLAGFLKSRRGGGMLIAGASGIAMLASVGAMMTNYAWREAQLEEIRNALRSAVAAASPLLSRAGETAIQAQIKDRVAKVITSLVEGLTASKDDVTITSQAGRRIITVSVGGTASYQFQDLWGGGQGGGQTRLPQLSVSVQIESFRYEVAIAADVTESMNGSISDGNGGTIVKVQALRDAIGAAADIMHTRNQEVGGGVSASIVPFAMAVNVADTSGTGETAGKKRYAHMLAGAAHNDADAADEQHWVDTFHDYGASSGDGMGELRYRTLPALESTASWNFRQSETIDISAQTPGFPSWAVQGEDFWNGCVMARWGAYWDPDARPSTWNANNPAASNWPAKANVNAWTTGSTQLSNEPLHLSDAAPNHAAPNTRFTAYSWPDARVRGTADGRLQAVLAEFLHAGETVHAPSNTDTWQLETLRNRVAQLKRAKHDNDWSLRGRSDPALEQIRGRTLVGGDGSSGCPDQSILPLTDSDATLRSHGNSLQVVFPHQTVTGGTMMHLGVVWGLRTLSPLWRSVWSVTDSQSASRPLTPCADGETGDHCQQNVRKSILLITDGVSGFGVPSPGRVGIDREAMEQYGNIGSFPTWPDNAKRNPGFGNNLTAWCGWVSGTRWAVRGKYKETADAANRPNESTFNTAVGGAFTGTRLTNLLNAFDDVMLTKTNGNNARTSAQTTAWTNVLSGLTPWQLFHTGVKTSGGTTTDIVDQLMDTANGFGFDGRPQHGGMSCRIWTPFTAYGRVGDRVQVGGRPVEGVSPFAYQTGWPTTSDGLNTSGKLTDIVNDWTDNACRIANARGVEIRAIFIGRASQTEPGIQQLRNCLTAAGQSQSNLYIAPTAASLENTFKQIFNLGRNVRFLN